MYSDELFDLSDALKNRAHDRYFVKKAAELLRQIAEDVQQLEFSAVPQRARRTALPQGVLDFEEWRVRLAEAPHGRSN